MRCKLTFVRAVCATTAAIFWQASAAMADDMLVGVFPKIGAKLPAELSVKQADALLSHLAAIGSGNVHALPSTDGLTAQDQRELDSIIPQVVPHALDQTTASLWITVENYVSEKIPAADLLTTIAIRPDEPSGSMVDFGAQNADTLARNVPNSWPLVISSRFDISSAVSGVHVAIKNKKVDLSIPKEAPENIRETLRESAKTVYESLHEHVAEKFGLNAAALHLDNEAYTLLLAEIDYVTSILEAFRLQSIKKLNATPQFPSSISIDFSGLKSVRESFGINSEEYTVAVDLLQRAISEIIQAFTAAHEGNLAGAVLAFNGQNSRLDRKGVILSRSAACPSQAECVTLSANCSNHGTCVDGSNSGCFSCSCAKVALNDDGSRKIGFNSPVHWTGSACQYQDISGSFHLLFWSSFALIVVIM
ncbi:hypothetical protein DFS34DRAFT_372503 [Phlyctochytrium arcticum]|nr:hypothetical protein DFS34DRAFT_372503 [Phlyctochytrium arcticum]